MLIYLEMFDYSILYLGYIYDNIMAMATPSYNITEPLTSEEVGIYVDANNKPSEQTPSANQTNIIIPMACASQNVSDSVHDGLKESGAQSALPQIFQSIRAQHEDPHLEQFLYTLDKNTPKATLLRDHMKNNYQSYFRIELFNGGNSNVDPNGTPIYGNNRVSVIETMLDLIGVANPNVFLSYDFGFPEVKCDIGYSKKRQFYIGYRPCQENDAAGKPSLSSKNINVTGILSSQVPVEFIWTNRQIEPFYTYLPRYTGDAVPIQHGGTPPSENYALSRFDMYIGWDRRPTTISDDDNEADVLKSCTIFHDPDAKELLLSNSDWTSKSGKNQAQYEKFSKELLSVKDKNPLELISPTPILDTHALTTAQFDLFHALAKNSGDKLTAITYPNSYTPNMLVSVINIIREVNPTFAPNYTGIDYLNDPELAGQIAEAIDAEMQSDSSILNAIITAMSSTRIADVITPASRDVNDRISKRSKPRLFKKLKNKNDSISSQYNYTYMWLTDYVFVYVTHDRLAAACALERFADIVILESPRSDERSVFSLFVRNDVINKDLMMAKNIANATLKKESIISIPYDNNFLKSITTFLGTPEIENPKPISEILSTKNTLEQYIDKGIRASTAITTVDANSDLTLKHYIVNGLITQAVDQFANSYDILSSSFIKLLQEMGIVYEHDKTIEYYTVELKRYISQLSGITPVDVSNYIRVDLIVYNIKKFLLVYNAFQELYDKMLILSQIMQLDLRNNPSLILGILSGVTDELKNTLSVTTNGQITALAPYSYINSAVINGREGRSMKDWFSSSKDALKRVITGDLPTYFGLTKLFMKLIPLMHDGHVNAIFDYFKGPFYDWMNTRINNNPNAKIDLKIIRKCVDVIFREGGEGGEGGIRNASMFMDKLSEYDELFTLINEEEKSMIKKLEKAGKTVVKRLSKKKQLLEDTIESQLSEKIKATVIKLIPSAPTIMSSIFGRRGGKTMHKYKSLHSGKKTHKSRKSGGANPISANDVDKKFYIEFLYKCITMYILYLTNILELYSPFIDVSPDFRIRLNNIAYIRDNAASILLALSSQIGGYFIDDSYISDNSPIEIYKYKIVSENNIPLDNPQGDGTSEYQIFILLVESFNFHLFNVNNYVSELDRTDESIHPALFVDLLSELDELLQDVHEKIIEYSFMIDITNLSDSRQQSNIDEVSLYQTLNSFINSGSSGDFNSGITSALIGLFDTYNHFTKSNIDLPVDPRLAGYISNTFINKITPNVIPISTMVVPYKAISKIDIGAELINTIPLMFGITTELQPIQLSGEEETTYEEIPYNEDIQPSKRPRLVYQSLDYTSENIPQKKMKDRRFDDKTFPKKLNSYAMRMGYNKRSNSSNSSNKTAWSGGSNSNKTLKLKKINRITRKKKLPHVRKTRKNTKRPKYIKKNATRRRR